MLFEGQPLTAGLEHDASVQRRIGAWLVDAAVAGILTAAALRLLMVATSPRGTVVHLVDVPAAWIAPVALAVWVLYRATTESSGASVGKRLFSVRVIHPGGRVGFGRAALRALTAPFDALLGHLEREGPFDRRMKLRVVKLAPAPGWPRWLLSGAWMALAAAGLAWLLYTPTGSLVTELHALQAKNRCGLVPRQVIHFTDRGNDLSTRRCDHVMGELSARARDGDVRAQDVLAALPYARDWGGAERAVASDR